MEGPLLSQWEYLWPEHVKAQCSIIQETGILGKLSPEMGTLILHAANQNSDSFHLLVFLLQQMG